MLYFTAGSTLDAARAHALKFDRGGGRRWRASGRPSGQGQRGWRPSPAAPPQRGAGAAGAALPPQGGREASRASRHFTSGRAAGGKPPPRLLKAGVGGAEAVGTAPRAGPGRLRALCRESRRERMAAGGAQRPLGHPPGANGTGRRDLLFTPSSPPLSRPPGFNRLLIWTPECLTSP